VDDIYEKPFQQIALNLLVVWAPNSKVAGMNCQKYNLLLENWSCKFFHYLKIIVCVGKGGTA
jgi:hypothetical protein